MIMASGKKIEIVFLSVSTESSTDQFIEHIKQKNDNLRCIFVKLTQQDLQSFQTQGTYDAVVLLHSISQGRNSITDVADAKYSKLLPQLKKKYGPDRVAVVVHSMTSFNPNTKMALMMVFRKSQPTTFQCSKCVIQCNNPAQMPDEDLTRLAEFLGKAPDHSLPIAEVEAPTTVTTAPSGDKTGQIGTENKQKDLPVPRSVPKEQRNGTPSTLNSSEVGSTSQQESEHQTIDPTSPINSGSPVDPLGVSSGSTAAPTPPANTQTSMTSPSSARSEDVHPQNRTSGTSQIGACSSDMAQISQASSQVDPLENPATERFVTQDKVIDTTYPIALIGLPSSNKTEKLKDDLKRQLPGKSIMQMKDTNDLKNNWHLFETILVDLGTSGTAPYSSDEFEGALNTCRKKMLVKENLAVLMLVPASSPSTHKQATDTIGQLAKANNVQIFEYGSGSGGQSLFNDDTKKRLVSWLHSSYVTYHTAANQKGLSFVKRVRNFVCSYF